MRKIKAEKLTKESFAPYGSYYDYTNPDGYSLNGANHSFFPDRITAYQPGQVGFSTVQVGKLDKMVVSTVEYHKTTCELIMPLDDDIILHVAPPSGGTPVPEHTKAFFVPKNTMVKINACVWHFTPLPVNKDKVSTLIILPECTYINDCIAVDLKDDEQFIIEK